MGTLKISIKDNKIFISGIDLGVENLERISTVCHKKKHLYLSGYEHGRKTRKKMANAEILFKEWKEHPGVCIAYTFAKKDEAFIISAFMAQQKQARKYTEDELYWFLSQWQQDVADELERVLS